MKLAIMQPYFFPYIGYFQLINAVDKFVFYDDVNYINRGWVNRNRILINSSPSYITVQLQKASQNKLINDIQINDNRLKLKKVINMAYKKAPYFDNVLPVIDICLDFKTNKISDLAIFSVKTICHYLGITKDFEISSIEYPLTRGLKGEQRLIEILRLSNFDTYINPIGGEKLYSKENFIKKGIKLYFLQSHHINYRQFNNDFIPWLSIIDIMMFNPVENIHKMLFKYSLL